MKASKKVNKCDFCDRETKTCVKLYDGNSVFCYDDDGNDEETRNIKEEWERAIDNSQTLASMIATMAKPWGVTCEAELVATTMLALKRMIHAVAGDDKTQRILITNHICEGLKDF